MTTTETTTATTDVYLGDAAYNQMLDDLVKIANRRDFEGTDLRSEIIMALGERGGVWPDSVLDDRCNVESVLERYRNGVQELNGLIDRINSVPGRKFPRIDEKKELAEIEAQLAEYA